MKYIFKQIDNISGRCAETTVEFSADALSDVVNQFEMFIRGCGFYPPGNLEFVDEEQYYGEPEPEEEHVSTQTLRNDYDSEWPFPKQRTVEVPLAESIYDDDLNSPSGGIANVKMFITKPISESLSAMEWTANELMKDKINITLDVCPICKIDNETMSQHECWDKNCPKGKDGNQG